LLERNLLTEAENYAKKGTAATEEDLKTRYDWSKDEVVRADFEKNYRNGMLGAYGKVLFKQQKYDEAEALLIKTESFQTLGEMYIAQNKMDKAEDAYISFLASAYRQEGAWKIIKEFYQKRTGNLNGYDKFEEKVKRIEAEKRREKIVADKLKTPKDIIPFELKDIAGKTINFADFKGKIVIVNVWGTWCNPCVIEMPEFQTLYKKYANDKDVAIVTIAQDEIEAVKKFMTEKKYDFPVMMDGSYLSQTNVNVFPTTWFVDKNGKISYIKIGSSPKLLEEFSWRIEALR
jgi:peroxiredoxin